MRQRGTFYSEKTTYGTDRDFPPKPRHSKRPPSYGPFKIADLPHTGYNKTIGRNFPYMEEIEQDPIQFKKDVKGPIWRDPTHGVSTPIKTVHDNFRNVNREKKAIFSR